MTREEVMPSEKTNDSSEITRQAILKFLLQTRSNAPLSTRSPPLSVENKVREVMQSWDLDIPMEQCEKSLIAGLHIGCSAYEHASYDYQVAMSLFTTCAIFLDDGLIDAQAVREFVPRFYTKEPQLSPALDRFVETTKHLCTFLPDYGANAVYASVLDYANEELWLSGDGKDLVLHPDSRCYVESSRIKGGIGVPYAFGIWPKSICADIKEYIQVIPNVLTIINGINDLFSYYKETLERDENNYIHQYARAHRKTLQDAVDDLVRNLISSVEKVRNILGEGKARDAWERFLSGFISFHLYCPRYELSKIVPEYF